MLPIMYLADDVAPRLVLDLLEGRGEGLLVGLRELAEQRDVLEELLVVGRVGLRGAREVGER